MKAQMAFMPNAILAPLCDTRVLHVVESVLGSARGCRGCRMRWLLVDVFEPVGEVGLLVVLMGRIAYGRTW